MPGDPLRHDIPVLDLSVSKPMLLAAQELVRNKYLIDKMAKERGATMLGGDLHDGAQGPHWGADFLRHVVPFLRSGKDSDVSLPHLVPTPNTLGCSWKWRRSDWDEAKLAAIRSAVTDTQRLIDRIDNPASYVWIKPLGLLAPNEGKNRVDFLREEGVDLIPAYVSEKNYPSADRIACYQVKANGFNETWAVLDGRWVQRLKHPSWTVPMLEAYGASVNLPWPDAYPQPQKVVLALFERPCVTSAHGSESGAMGIVDMKTIQARDNHQQQIVRVSGIQLKHVKCWRWVWVTAALGFIASSILMAVAPNDWFEIQMAAAIALGFSLAAGIVPLLVPLWFTQRRHVDGEPLLPRDLAPKHRPKPSRRLLG